MPCVATRIHEFVYAGNFPLPGYHPHCGKFTAATKPADMLGFILDPDEWKAAEVEIHSPANLFRGGLHWKEFGAS